MSIRGSLVDLKKENLTGKYAQARNLEARTIWRGALAEGGAPLSKPRLYFFVITDFPQGVQIGDGVELYGAFFKVWFYQSQNRGTVNAPVLIGKQLRILPPKPAPPIDQWITLVSIIIFGMTCLFIGFAVYSERKEARPYRKKYHKRNICKKRICRAKTSDAC